MDEQLLHEFDDWELRCPPDDKGKTPLFGDEETDEQEQPLSSEDMGGADGVEGEEEAGGDAPHSPRGSEPGDLTCAICLGGIPLENLAMVKGCDHMYCATCILHWALHKEEPWCPQCKQPFSYLLTYRTLDGTLHDFPTEESVCLLKRARWFEEHLRFVDQNTATLVEQSRLAEQVAWQEYDEYEDDEEIEQYYFSSAAGRARVVLGNRRYGEGGFISAGRRQARPVERKRTNKAGKSGEHAVVGTPPVVPSAVFRTPNAGGGRKGRPASGGDGAGASSSKPVPTSAGSYGSSPGASGSGLYGTSPSGNGRRARRNARRAALDAGIEAAVGGFGA